jgi:hypothetical protein
MAVAELGQQVIHPGNPEAVRLIPAAAAAVAVVLGQLLQVV